MDAAPFDGAALDKLNAVRNVIAHKGGWVTENEREKFKCYGFEKTQPLKLPCDFLEENKKLVRKTCLLIVEGIEDFLEEKGFKI